MSLTHRLAQRDDLDALRALMDAAISELQELVDERGGAAVPLVRTRKRL